MKFKGATFISVNNINFVGYSVSSVPSATRNLYKPQGGYRILATIIILCVLQHQLGVYMNSYVVSLSLDILPFLVRCVHSRVCRSKEAILPVIICVMFLRSNTCLLGTLASLEKQFLRSVYYKVVFMLGFIFKAFLQSDKLLSKVVCDGLKVNTVYQLISCTSTPLDDFSNVCIKMSL